MCRHVCPVGHVTARETLTPHAWALTIESVRRGQLAWNRETAAVMYACADCGLCQAHCVTDQPLPDAVVAARAEIVRAGAAPEAVRAYREQIAGNRERSARDVFSAAPPEKPSRALVPRAVFVGDAGASHGGDLAAALRLLEAAGLPAATFGDGQSTGLVASSLGLTHEAAEQARDVVAGVIASGVAQVLVLGPADKWTFEHVYPVRLGVQWPGDVSITEVTMALADALDDGRLRVGRGDALGAAYHDPCHGPRIRRDASAPRRLLAAMSADDHRPELFWREERAHPCGAIGGLPLTQPEIARELALARCRDAAAAGAGLLVTDDPACASHLARHAGDTVRVQGLYALLAGRLEKGVG
jgi:Fe-S oxidoreductase